jgi:RNA polymerase sigma-70 factor, ECF subfamily
MAEPESSGTEQLLQQAKAGDRQAFERLLAAHQAYLRELVNLRMDPRLRPRIDPSDIVQETQLEAYRRLPRYLADQPMPFRLWLRQIAHDRLLMLRRQHVGAARRTVEREVPLPEAASKIFAGQLAAGGSSPSQQLSRRESVRQIGQAMARLIDADREILLLRNFEGLSYSEAACLLHVDEATARKRYGRALLRLRTMLFDDPLMESRR